MSELKEARRLVRLKAKALPINVKLVLIVLAGLLLMPQLVLISRSNEKLTSTFFSLTYSLMAFHALMYFLALGVICDLIQKSKK